MSDFWFEVLGGDFGEGKGRLLPNEGRQGALAVTKGRELVLIFKNDIARTYRATEAAMNLSDTKKLRAVFCEVRQCKAEMPGHEVAVVCHDGRALLLRAHREGTATKIRGLGVDATP